MELFTAGKFQPGPPPPPCCMLTCQLIAVDGPRQLRLRPAGALSLRSNAAWANLLPDYQEVPCV